MKRRRKNATELERLTAQGRHDWQQFCAGLGPLLTLEAAADEARRAEALRDWMALAPETLGGYLTGVFLYDVVGPMLPLVVAHPPEERAEFMRKIGAMVVGVAEASMEEAARTAER
jgi:hypothetical protein